MHRGGGHALTGRAVELDFSLGSDVKGPLESMKKS
jgi:hypothetical protein